MRTLFVLSFSTFVLVACGGETLTGPQSDAGNPNAPKCPATVPADGDPCVGSLQCTYPSGAHGACTVTANCVSSAHWSVAKPGPTCGGNPAACPAAYSPSLPGSACTPGGTTCDLTEARCQCLPCFADAGSANEWVCRAWTDVGSGCPTDAPPVAGTACKPTGLTCNYSQLCGISLGPDLQCQNGQWVVVPSPAGLCIMRTCK